MVCVVCLWVQCVSLCVHVYSVWDESVMYVWYMCKVCVVCAYVGMYVVCVWHG